jgi:dipeptidyl aminopeptidase/acylaminoacyl peptidase
MLDGTGYLPKERWHIWLIDASDGQGRPLTDSDLFDEIEPCWSPDGKRIAFVSNRGPDPDLDPDAVDLYLAPVNGGEPRRLDTPLGRKRWPSFSPDGTRLAYIGREGRGMWWKNSELWVVPIDGSGPARNMTGSHDIYVGNGTLGDLSDRPTVRPAWSADSRRLYFQVTRHGDTGLQSVSLHDNGMKVVVNRPGSVGSFSIDKDGQKIACCHGCFTDPGQIWLHDFGGSDFSRLTTFNHQLLAGVTLGEIQEVWFKGRDDNDVQGWILKPPDFDPGKSYPSILEIHGGPWLQYGRTFMHEFYYLAAQGYVVYFCNPRGGQGYGETHSKAIDDNWGSVDYADLMAWVDTMVEQPYIDPERMGVTGGSYGGYMTSWIIGHTSRFRAAVAQRLVSNLISMWGSSDLNWSFQEAFGGKPPWENLENYWRQSPMAHIGNATTPTLIIHSEQDMRCHPEQGLQLFVALKRLGVDTELVLFPNEPHGLSRNGRTNRRVVRLQHIFRWFDRYLKG